MSSNSMGTCPLGGLWYTCEDQTPTFFGCCTSNPCNGVGCPDSDLRAAGMGTGSGPDDNTNDGSYWPNVQCPLGGSWYTCSQQTPSFQGCCESNMCNGSNTVCPNDQLHPAAFSTVPAVITSWAHSTAAHSTAAPSSKPSTSSTTAVSLAASTSPSSSTSPSFSTSSPSSTSPSSSFATIKSESTTPVGTIVGGTVGGVVGGAVIITILILIYLWRRNRQGKERNAAFGSEFAVPTHEFKGYQSVSQTMESPQPSPLPPSYRSPSVYSPTLPDHYEIYSNVIHEVESPTPKQGAFQPGIAELPDTLTTERFRNSAPL